MQPKELFEAHKRVIDRIISLVCNKNGWYGDECDDFRSEVYLKLIEHDCKRLRSFRGGSSFERFIAVVIGNLARDERNKRWGKWRPSAKARSLGPIGVWLERLLYRDGASFAEACEIIGSATGGRVSRPQLQPLAAELKPKKRPVRTPNDELASVPGDDEADRNVGAREALNALEQVKRCLDDALARLGDEDTLIVKMRFFDGITVAAISRALRLDQKGLYERVNKIVARLRELINELCPEVDGFPDFGT